MARSSQYPSYPGQGFDWVFTAVPQGVSYSQPPDGMLPESDEADHPLYGSEERLLLETQLRVQFLQDVVSGATSATSVAAPSEVWEVRAPRDRVRPWNANATLGGDFSGVSPGSPPYRFLRYTLLRRFDHVGTLGRFVSDSTARGSSGSHLLVPASSLSLARDHDMFASGPLVASSGVRPSVYGQSSCVRALGNPLVARSFSHATVAACFYNNGLAVKRNLAYHPVDPGSGAPSGTGTVTWSNSQASAAVVTTVSSSGFSTLASDVVATVAAQFDAQVDGLLDDANGRSPPAASSSLWYEWDGSAYVDGGSPAVGTSGDGWTLFHLPDELCWGGIAGSPDALDEVHVHRSLGASSVDV